jgi:raffinose/stachyose/melibiose transport system permease protein
LADTYPLERAARISTARIPWQRHVSGWLFVGPAVLVLAAFIIYPIFYSLSLSLYEWNGFTRDWGDFVGLDNYKELLTDKAFWRTAWHSIAFVIIRTPLEVGIAFGLALLLNKNLPGRGLLRTLFFVPVVMSLIVVTLLFQRILEANNGLLNVSLRSLGLGAYAPGWLANPDLALMTVILVSVWKNVGFSLVILLAGLQGMPTEVIEAAKVDGASNRQVTWRIITPLMRPIIAIAAMLSIIGGLKVFDLVYIMTAGGPDLSTEIFATMLYRKAFELHEMGVASALAVIMVIVIMGTSWLQTIFLRER